MRLHSLLLQQNASPQVVDPRRGGDQGADGQGQQGQGTEGRKVCGDTEVGEEQA